MELWCSRALKYAGTKGLLNPGGWGGAEARLLRMGTARGEDVSSRYVYYWTQLLGFGSVEPDQSCLR